MVVHFQIYDFLLSKILLISLSHCHNFHSLRMRVLLPLSNDCFSHFLFNEVTALSENMSSLDFFSLITFGSSFSFNSLIHFNLIYFVPLRYFVHFQTHYLFLSSSLFSFFSDSFCTKYGSCRISSSSFLPNANLTVIFFLPFEISSTFLLLLFIQSFLFML